MQRRQGDSIGRHRRAAFAFLAAGAISACGARQPAGQSSAALAPAAGDSLDALIDCARTETARLGYQPVSNQARAVTGYFDVDHPDAAQWFVAERIGSAPGRVVVVAEARRDRTGRPVLLAAAMQLDNSSRTIAWENTTTIRRSISWASTRGTEPVPAPLTADIRADVESLQKACATPPSSDISIRSSPRASR